MNSLGHDSCHHIVQNNQNRKSWRAENLRICSPPPFVTCHMSHVTCHVSLVMCRPSSVNIFFWTVCWSVLGEGVLSTGPTLPSFVVFTKG